MTEAEIIEGNKAIAEFNGFAVQDKFVSKEEVINGCCRYQHIPYSHLLYHSDWDLLMPVVENIENKGYIVEIWLSLGKGCRIYKPITKSSMRKIFTAEGNSTIEVVWQAVVDVAKCYNKEQQSKRSVATKETTGN